MISVAISVDSAGYMKDVKNKSKKELEKLLYEKRKDLRIFRFSVSGSKIKNVKDGGNIKKDIAQILTELNTQKQSPN